MNKSPTTTLAKYSTVAIKERKKVTTASASARFAEETTARHALDGRVVVVKKAASTVVSEKARKVINTHSAVIKRLASR